MKNVAKKSATDPQAREPSGARVITGRLHRRRGRGRTFHDDPPRAAEPRPVRRPARVAQLLALVHRLERAIERGVYADQADAARKLGITRSRVSQILEMTLLAPDIQEEILFLEAVDGVEPMSERALRDVLRCESWVEQRGARGRILMSTSRAI